MEIVLDGPRLEALLAQIFPQVHGDFRIEDVSESNLRLRLFAAEKHLRPGGTISGPAIFALTDCAMYLAVMSRIGPVALAVTTNCAIDFMRKPAAGRDLLCDLRLLKLGRNLAVGDALVFSEAMPAPVARASLTYSIPPREQAAS